MITQKTANKINNELERLNDVTYSDRKMVLRYMKNYINSLVSEDVRNHHQGICFRVNEDKETAKRYLEWEKAFEDSGKKIVEGTYGFPPFIQWLEESEDADKEIAKRMIEEYIKEDEDYGAFLLDDCDIETLRKFKRWLDKDKE